MVGRRRLNISLVCVAAALVLAHCAVAQQRPPWEDRHATDRYGQPVVSPKPILCPENNTLINIVGVGAVICYFGIVQLILGRDPRKRAVVPQWDPPEGLSPAVLRYLYTMSCDKKVIACALASIAQKGHLHFDNSGGHWALVGRESSTELTAEESALMHRLFRDGNTLVMQNWNSGVIQAAINQLVKTIRASLGNRLYARHTGYCVAGMFLSVFALIAAFLSTPVKDTFVPGPVLMAFFVVFTIAAAESVVLLTTALMNTGESTATRDYAKLGVFFSIPFVAIDLVILALTAQATSVANVVSVFVLAIVNAIFFQILRAYTKEGRELMDKIEGFRLYLKMDDTVSFSEAPDRNAEAMAELIPYAVALDANHPSTSAGPEDKYAHLVSELTDLIDSTMRADDGALYSSRSA